MRRSSPTPLTRLPQLKAELQERFSTSPLGTIATELVHLIDACDQDPKFQQALEAGIETLLRFISAPASDRFLVDSSIIQNACDAMSSAAPKMSNWIVPCYSGEWGHMFAIALPGDSRRTVRPLYLLSLCGNPELADANLLDYPWMYHELAHNLLLRHDEEFSKRVHDVISQTAKSLRLRSIADRGAAKQKALGTIETIVGLWSALPNHRDWSHELAADIIGVWICGPPYIAAFCDSLEGQDVDPYLVASGHPPYELRAQAIGQVGQELGWRKATVQLANLMRSWKTSRWAPGRGNAYVAATHPVLIEKITTVVLQFCEHLKVPKCTEQAIERARHFLLSGQTPESSIDLITAAWLIFEERGRKYYEAWESRTLDEIAAWLHGDSD